MARDKPKGNFFRAILLGFAFLNGIPTISPAEIKLSKQEEIRKIVKSFSKNEMIIS